MNDIFWSLKANNVLQMINNKKRIDGRKFDEMRKITIETGFAHVAEGSARVKLGETEVVAGIKVGLGTPYPDSPDKGAMATMVELTPVADPRYEVGPPRIGAVEVGRVVDRCVREGSTIDFEKLCIEEGELVYMVFIDAYAINNDGNLYDAAALAAAKALMESKLPKVENGKIVKGEYAGKLPLLNNPVLSSFAKIGNSILLDPKNDEDHAATARFHVGVEQNDLLCAFQKGGFGSFTQKEIDQCCETAVKNAKELRKLL